LEKAGGDTCSRAIKTNALQGVAMEKPEDPSSLLPTHHSSITMELVFTKNKNIQLSCHISHPSITALIILEKAMAPRLQNGHYSRPERAATVAQKEVATINSRIVRYNK
jgi:hypothetical protein